MGKRLFIVFFLALLVIFFIFAINEPSITGFFTYSDKSQKTSSEVLNELDKKETIRVVIDVDDSPVERGGRSLFSSSKLDKKQLPGKIRHDFGNKMSLEITQEELEELEENSNIKKIGLVGKKQLFLQDSVPLVNASSTWNIKINNTNLTGKGQTICVIDTGANFSHPDLYGKNQTCIIDCANISGGGCIENCSLTDTDGHGTHVSGIIAANGNIKGIASESKLVVINVFESSNNAYDDDIAAAIDWCVNNASKFNISVISMSLGGGNFSMYCDSEESDFLTPAINNAFSKNISVIAATGNQGNYTHISSPACIQNVTSVGMTYDKDVGGMGWTDSEGDPLCTDSSTFEDKIVCASNRNNITDLFAPGSRINSTDLTGYILKDGTSMATPHVAGAFALINQFKKLESNKILSPLEIKNTLNLTGKRIYDSESGLNFSRIDIYSAILSLDETSPEVNLISPENNYFENIENLTLSCDATDKLQLKNLTIKLWNSSGNLINETTLNATETLLEAEMNQSNLEQGDYYWNCISYDNNGNKGLNSENYSFSIRDISVNLISPENYYYSTQNSTSFNCSAQTSSGTSLSNMTFYLWNKNSELINNQTKTITGTLDSVLFDYEIQNQSEYLWNCLAKNNESYFSFAPDNYTFIYDEFTPIVVLNSPQNNTYTDQDSAEFNCSINLSSSTPLSNITLYLWNYENSDLVDTLVENASGNSTSVSFDYTLQNEIKFLWNCEAKSNNSFDFASSSNYSITYDNTLPEIELLSPQDGRLFEYSQTIDFEFNVTEENLDSCSLIINDSITKTDSSINSGENSFSEEFEIGDYYWKIRCVDLAENKKDSEERELFIDDEISEEGTFGAAGLPGEEENTSTEDFDEYNLSDKEIEKGVSKNLNSGDIVYFNIKNSSHELNVNDVEGLGANITIKSKIFTFVLGIGESKKIDFDSDKYYDLVVKLNSISSDEANITLKKINEEIPTKRTFFNEPTESNTPSKEDSSENSLLKNPGFFGFIFILIILLAFLLFEFKNYLEKKTGKKYPIKKSLKSFFDWLKNKFRSCKNISLFKYFIHSDKDVSTKNTRNISNKKTVFF